MSHDDLNFDPDEPTVIPDPQAYDRPGDIPTSEVPQDRSDLGKEPSDDER